MAVNFLKMNDDSIVLLLSSGPTTINKDTINYRPICNLLQQSSTTEEEITKLLNVLPTNGIFKAFASPYYFSYTHIDKDFKVHGEVLYNPKKLDTPNTEFKGSYASKEDMIADFPEFFI